MNDSNSKDCVKLPSPTAVSRIMGFHAVQEVLEHAPERLVRIFTERGKRGELIERAEKKGVAIAYVSSHELSRMAGSDSHQSLVAHVKERNFLSLERFFQKAEGEKRVLALMCDRIFDPQNFGALLRCAECFGVAGVVWSKNRGVDMTPVVAKASSGASELLSLIRVSNLADALCKFQERGFEAVVAAPDRGAENLTTFCFAPRTLLIVGSEGEGAQPLLQAKCDRKVFIPLMGKIASLNVAQATAVLLSWACRNQQPSV